MAARQLAVPEAVSSAAPRWRMEAVGGGAQDLHDLDVPVGRLVRVHVVDVAAVVLGSTQDPQLVTGAAGCGLAVARRHSGGGAVWLAPDAQVWIDLVIPADDHLWCDDVGVASHWVGETWVAGWGSDASGTEVWHGAMSHRELSRVACFAGLGPGEVTAGGRKVVGISQRRTRRWARFQCVSYLWWDPEPLLSVLTGHPDLDRLRHRLTTAVGALPRIRSADPTIGTGAQTGSPMWDVVERFVKALP